MKKISRLLRYDWPVHFFLVITNWLPDNVIFIRLRGKLIKPFFKKCGQHFGVGRNVTFYNPSKIEIGSYVYIGYGCWLGGEISIENEVMLGPYCVLAPTNHKLKNGSFRFGENSKGRILLKHGSWMGAHSIIVGNSTLGEGSVLAANSLLNCYSEDHSIYGGSPAVKLKECR